ncbi:aldose epimerase family protein [Aurantimonas sp. 22II-16-19i]|uniref:aldose epimerase family protein n=1 Tax=Aurantimonas sp. 22II-16-19i TaxID=1317114 RepID=UPI0009F7D5CA|nr:aldose epimerase family protein [Aurantimonas sp. 22II-16-19i]ORE94762.1 aldose 1-epimerase [Aurantimonas sp. 22II-16-19i]
MDEASFTIEHDGMSAEILAVGASLVALRPRGAGHSMVLGLRQGGYGASNRAYVGSSVGRFANRIAFGRFALDGRDHVTPVNDGPHHLHGGPAGFSTRAWSLVSRTSSEAVLALRSEDGDEGYPGRVDARAIFTIIAGDELQIAYEAVTDRPTIVNLTSHLYFNLSGDGDILGHRLTVAADRYLPIDETTIPTGEIAPVEGTRFDFRRGRPLAERPEGLDHNFCLASQRSAALRPAATLACEASGWTLEMTTSEPGLQVYDGAKFDGSQESAAGTPLQAFAGLALEPQIWPDAPNRPNFPSALLLPGETYRNVSRYRFINGSSAVVHEGGAAENDE